jgi:hypothetical protein
MDTNKRYPRTPLIDGIVQERNAIPLQNSLGILGQEEDLKYRMRVSKGLPDTISVARHYQKILSQLQ